MKMFEVSPDYPVAEIKTVGLNGEMLEAQAFAYFAVRVKRGLPTSCSNTSNVLAAVSGGTISSPTSQLRTRNFEIKRG
jgi:anhydro-N-acetylmuramic acid kinase